MYSVGYLLHVTVTGLGVFLLSLSFENVYRCNGSYCDYINKSSATSEKLPRQHAADAAWPISCLQNIAISERYH